MKVSPISDGNLKIIYKFKYLKDKGSVCRIIKQFHIDKTKAHQHLLGESISFLVPRGEGIKETA